MTRTVGVGRPSQPTTANRIERTADRLTAARAAAEEKRRRDVMERLAAPVGGSPPEAVLVRAGDVRFDPRYQTADRFDPARSNRIALGWNWTRYKAIVVNVRPDDPTEAVWCPDGRHRVNAAIARLGADVRLVALLHRLPYEGEAAIFAEQHEEEKRVSEGHRFNAEKEAGDAVALAEQALLDRLGLAVARNAGHMAVPIRTFLGSYRRWGEAVVEEALAYAIDQLGGGAEALEANVVKGLVGFVAAYRDHEEYRPAVVRQVLRETTVDRLKKEASRKDASLNEYDRITGAIVSLYNHRRTRRLPTWNGRGRGGNPR